MKPNKIYILHDIGKTELTPEEAKEHLSDTELPPNMKKIIEGVGKMSKYLEESYNEALRENLALIEQNKKLLAKLEIAEKALEKLNVANVLGEVNVDDLMLSASILTGTHLLIHEENKRKINIGNEAKKNAKEALKQIRE